ncbi:hypothetical protein HII28_15020 [Planctomonas sp. JC2975]|uniref:hypothetical protein n=1 Tax=Planctomonas sp. JC2975 TaxID=2729626 RepID=UPI001476506E|nr:hypothetical protein [Planctomonas sp. JC2975]NNC13185.1 hypothetical protein [Planctomonas sp. JC2975]
MRSGGVMAVVGTVLLTWLVAVDTWMRLTLDAEPTSLTIVALAVAVGVLAAVAALAVRDALTAAGRVARAPALTGVSHATGSRQQLPSRRVHLVGGRGPRAPGGGFVPACDIMR